MAEPAASPLTITDAAAALRAGELTSVELTAAGFAVADAELASGVDRGPLHGIPLGIKDIIACLEGPTTANSVVDDPSWFAGRDAPVVARLRAAGAVMTGKLTTMEYAVGLPDASKPFPVPHNPWDLDTWPGGSSSGSGSGVAAGMFLGALGTDTGGSVRMPAAFCGISGMKQTYGLVPKSGCLPLGETFDHIGPMARSAADCAAMLAVMAGHEPGDSTVPAGVVGADYPAQLTGDLEGLTIGVDRVNHLGRPGEDPVLAAVFEAAVATLAAAGATVVDVELPLYEVMGWACMTGALTEAFGVHRVGMAERWADYGQGLRNTVGQGALLTGADYAQSLKVRRVARDQLAQLYRGVDLVVTPTATAGAPALEGLTWDSFASILHCGYWNGVGYPALSVPMGSTVAGLPLGLHIAGRPYEDGLVLRAGDAYQRRTDAHLRLPPLLSAVSV